MDDFATYVRAITSNEWIYLIVFLIAIAEANVLTSYFLSGTMGFVLVGILIHQGLLDPTWSMLAIYAGTVLGDASGFLLSHWLQRISFVAAMVRKVDWARASLAASPTRFIVIGHFTPYLQAALPVLAAGVVPFRKYVAIDLAGAAAGTVFLVGFGYLLSTTAEQLHYRTALTIIGVVATLAIAILWSRRRPTAASGKPTLTRARSLGRTIRFVVLYPFWHPARWIEMWLRGRPSRSLRRSLEACFPDIRAGDILLIRLHWPAPWGRWAHTAIAIDGQNFCHGFTKVVTAHSLAALPVRYAIAQLRCKCPAATAQVAADVARGFVGRRVSVIARQDDGTKVSCASLVSLAYARAGIELVGPQYPRVTPDDIFTSDQLSLVRIVHTERVRLDTHRYVFEAREQG